MRKHSQLSADICRVFLRKIEEECKRIITNVLRSLQMACHQYEWLAIAYENVAEMLSLRILGACF